MLSKTLVLIILATSAMATLAMAAPPLEKESHDDAYNSIISQGGNSMGILCFGLVLRRIFGDFLGAKLVVDIHTGWLDMMSRSKQRNGQNWPH